MRYGKFDTIVYLAAQIDVRRSVADPVSAATAGPDTAPGVPVSTPHAAGAGGEIPSPGDPDTEVSDTEVAGPADPAAASDG